MSEPRPVGRPRKEIDIEHLKRLVQIQCTAEECAAVLGVTAPTLDMRIKDEGYENFLDFQKEHGASGRASLRRMQWKAAQDGNVTAQIWLGKQILGQTDKTESRVTHDISAEMEDYIRSLNDKRARPSLAFDADVEDAEVIDG